MIFNLVQTAIATFLVFPSDIDIYDMYDIIAPCYPNSFIGIAHYGGYQNAIAIYKFK